MSNEVQSPRGAWIIYTMSSINERIKSIRKELGLTQTELGDKLGIGKSAMSKLEQENATVTDRNVEFICREFNVRRDYLLYGKGDMFLDPEDCEPDLDGIVHWKDWKDRSEFIPV